MQDRINITGKVYNGSFPSYMNDMLKSFIKSNEGKTLEIKISIRRGKRSLPQNRFYWGVVIPIIHDAFKQLGHRLNPEEVHFFLKQKFNYHTVVTEHGELIGELPKSTTELNKLEFMEYIDKITQWCAEILNIQIPEPKQYDL